MQSIKTYALPFIGSLVISLLFGIICGAFGSFLASLFFPEFVFGSLVGYEAGGIAFFLLGLIAGGVYGTLFLARRLLKTVSQKSALGFVLFLYGVSASLWIMCDMFHLPNEIQVVILIFAWVMSPVLVLWKQK